MGAEVGEGLCQDVGVGESAAVGRARDGVEGVGLEWERAEW